MTILDRLHRMETCARCATGDCEIGRDAPVDCGCCSEYVGIWREDKEVRSNVDLSGVKVYIPVDELWIFYLQNEERCKNEMILVAENTETGYAIYVTEEDGHFVISVCKDEEDPEYDEYVLNNEDCENTAKKLFLNYLVPVSVSNDKAVVSNDSFDDPDDDSPEPTRQDLEDEVYEREDELDIAMKDFLATVLQEPDIDRLVESYSQGFVDGVLDCILQTLAQEYGCEIYRPMFIEDEETGCEIYTQFPYNDENDDAEVKGGEDG